MVQRRLVKEALELVDALHGDDGGDLVGSCGCVGRCGEVYPGFTEGEPGLLCLLDAVEVDGAVGRGVG